VVAAELGVCRRSRCASTGRRCRHHPYISTGLKENKFGIAIADAEDVYVRAAQLPNLEVVGVDCHIGSQLTTLPPFLDALDRLLVLVDRLGDCGIHLRHIDLGGGVGVRYRDEEPPLVADYIKAVRERLDGATWPWCSNRAVSSSPMPACC
jgi:diaminopimelate decarboxylase